MGHEAKVSAREINDLSAQLPLQHPVWLVWQLVARVASPCEHNPPCKRLECVKIELNSRILAQLMLHPVRSVRHGGLVRVLCHSTLYHLTVDTSNNRARKLAH